LLRAAVARIAIRLNRHAIWCPRHRDPAAEALALVDELLAQSDDQQLIAYRSTALRLLGDPRCRLYDYDRLVRSYRLQPPANFPRARVFARELRFTMRRIGRSRASRGGAQIQQPSGKSAHPAFFSMIDSPIRDYISRLEKGDAHRSTAAIGVVGSRDRGRCLSRKP
jgi:hypothetical protein